MADKRIIELANEKLVLADGDMTIVDSESGTYKYDLNRLAKKTITDSTLSVEGKPADAKAVGDALNSVDVDTVNNARQLLSESYVLDQEPYLFRASGGEGADRVEECIVGGTVAWNQLIENGDFAIATGWSGDNIAVANNKATISKAGATVYIEIRKASAFMLLENHKYLILVKASASSGKLTMLPTGLTSGGYKSFEGITSEQWISMIHAPSSNQSVYISIRVNLTASGVAENLEGTFSNYQCIDLTQLFGSTIADYIYSLEQATAGAGVAWFRKLFPKDYYEYDAGTLKSVEGLSSHDMVGFNQWDEEWENGYWSRNTGQKESTNTTYIRCKDYISVVPSTTYYVKTPTSHASNNTYFAVLFYKADKTYISAVNNIAITPTFTTPSDCHFITFYSEGASSGQTYQNDICINLSWDGERDGEYEPYVKHSYPLDDSLVLRGIPKLDSSNQLYWDGDTYESDGTVTRKYGVRAYQSGDANSDTMLTDGTNTVYKLTTPTTETAHPYTYLQTLDPHGTEEFVSTGIVPVGHESHYLENLRSKIEGLPKDFSTLIAPTEKEYKATQNYTVGKLLIVNNILYKVTANIANGANIVPNTNVTAKPLSEIIAELA